MIYYAAPLSLTSAHPNLSKIFRTSTLIQHKPVKKKESMLLVRRNKKKRRLVNSVK